MFANESEWPRMGEGPVKYIHVIVSALAIKHEQAMMASNAI